jgi:uncharacterized membrane protein HdeD (DUF308 family)
MIQSTVAERPVLAEGDGKRVASLARAAFIGAAGGAIIVLGIGAVLLPAFEDVSATIILGSLLITAGFLEVCAGKLRHETRRLAMLAGLITALAGALVIVNRADGLLPSASVVTGWLLARSAILLLTSRLAHGSVRKFLGLSASTDFVLGVGLLTGVSVTTLAVTVFGSLPLVLTGYGWLLALSFLATGTFLFEVASCERAFVRQLPPSCR